MATVSSWVKCRVCGLVREGQGGVCTTCVAPAGEPEHGADGVKGAIGPRAPRRRASGSSADSVRQYRARTDNAYGKAYAKARAAAVTALIAKHPDDFADLLEKARVDCGLGPTRRA